MASTIGAEVGMGERRPDIIASADQLRRLQSVTDAALANLTVEDLMDELLIRVREALSTDTAAILLHDESTRELVATAAKGIEEEVEQGVRIPLGKGFAGTIAATAQPVAIFDVDHSNVLNPILREKGIRSLLGVPLVVRGSVLGVLHVGTLTHRRFTNEDVILLQLVADRVAIAIHARLSERERAIARTLQRSLLPERLPTVAGIEIAARYLPATGGEVGGDWFDVFVLPDGSVAVVIGDVVGRGLPAASTMGKTRSAIRAYALDSGPSVVLEQMNRLLRHLDPGEMVTVLFGVADPIRSSFRFSCAGHVPPVFRDPDGTVRVVELGSGPPLGATAVPKFEERVEELAPGSSILLYTDGLIERPGESIDEGLDRLRLAARVEAEPEEMCDSIVRELLGPDEHGDDVALLVARMVGIGPELHVTIEAHASRLVVVRRLLDRWLYGNGLIPERRYDVIAATGEATANAVEHAYGPAGGEIRIDASRSDDTVVVRVLDRGRWRPPRGPSRGRGLPLMQALADEVRIRHEPEGTSVELRWTAG
jgi:anti-sigma regulatory factor (Ser/Thr protein kinase)/putative methionine-R-sulfoxide reductase with GAF domain